MELNIAQASDKATITIAGKLSVATSPELETAVRGLPESIANVEMDLTDLEYISSAGLRVLVATEKLCASRSGKMRLLHPNAEVSEVFEMTGLADVFTIEA